MIVLLSIGGAVSLIGIFSAATTYHYFGLGVVAGQGQQSIQRGQIVGQQISPQQQLSVQQIKQDKQLVDRIFPYIIERIDGKTLAQKIDVGILLQKINDKVLAAKVLPYLDLKVSVVEKAGNRFERSNALHLTPSKSITEKASCPPDTTVISGGFSASGVNQFMRDFMSGNGWMVNGLVNEGQHLEPYAYCLKVELGLNPTYEAPGGPPLRPPPEFGK
jgi:hypothetical protein